AALAPQLGLLKRRHQNLDGAGAVLLLADDVLDPLEHAKTKRQPIVDAGGSLADQAGAKHQPVADDLRFRRRLFQKREEIAGKAHGIPMESLPFSRVAAAKAQIP